MPHTALFGYSVLALAPIMPNKLAQFRSGETGFYGPFLLYIPYVAVTSVGPAEKIISFHGAESSAACELI